MWEFPIYYANRVFLYGNLCSSVFHVASNWRVLLVVMHWSDRDKSFYIEYLLFLEHYNTAFFCKCVRSKYLSKSAEVTPCSPEHQTISLKSKTWKSILKTLIGKTEWDVKTFVNLWHTLWTLEQQRRATNNYVHASKLINILRINIVHLPF